MALRSGWPWSHPFTSMIYIFLLKKKGKKVKYPFLSMHSSKPQISLFSSTLTILCLWKNRDWSYPVSHQRYGLKMMRCYSDWLYNQRVITTIAWWSFLQDINSLFVKNKVLYFFIFYFNVNNCMILSIKWPFNYESVLQMLGISLLEILGIVWILSYSLPCINWEVYQNRKKTMMNFNKM